MSASGRRLCMDSRKLLELGMVGRKFYDKLGLYQE
jgi:hypothetical protein